jgi:hypothetical protein
MSLLEADLRTFVRSVRAELGSFGDFAYQEQIASAADVLGPEK